tara:strand:+ start:2434 stop:2907 length:474 start_codon:yes stop_codon:yes gene_type:complete
MKLPSKMNYLLKNTILSISILFSVSTYSQTECDQIDEIVNEMLNNPIDEAFDRTFISDGQIYKAFIDEDEKAEFKLTLYGGSTYRIAGSAGDKNNSFVFEVYDTEFPRNLLFSNTDYNNCAYWDFKIENTIDCYIVTGLDLTKKLSGCTVMMIAFEN